MNSQEISKYFQYHNKNIQLIKISYLEIREAIKANYKDTDEGGNYVFLLDETDPKGVNAKNKEIALSRILAGVQVSWAEESIKRLFYEKDLLTDGQRNYLLEIGALDQRWYKTLKLIFCIAYDLVSANDEICTSIDIRRERRNLGSEVVDKYFELKDIITNFVVPNFQLRNKVQHGEWAYAFKPRYSKVYSQDLTDRLKDENIITTTSRFNLVNTFYNLIVDLGRFKSDSFAIDSMLTPFEYFYNERIEKIKFEMIKISIPEKDNFILDLINKDKRGKDYRKK